MDKTRKCRLDRGFNQKSWVHLFHFKGTPLCRRPHNVTLKKKKRGPYTGSQLSRSDSFRCEILPKACAKPEWGTAKQKKSGNKESGKVEF